MEPAATVYPAFHCLCQPVADHFFCVCRMIYRRWFCFDKARIKRLYSCLARLEQIIWKWICRSETNEIFSMCRWNGYDNWRLALLCLSWKNEILDSKNCRHTWRLVKTVRTGVDGTWVGFNLFRSELKISGGWGMKLYTLMDFDVMNEPKFKNQTICQRTDCGNRR